MAFIDNSGDVILDVVLTDTGKFRLAKGDGSFKIVKFALGDDEINYANFDGTNVSGSAYYDLNILQTPILEAFSNNASSMKSKLLSIPRTNLLYLPILKLNEIAPSNKQYASDSINSTFVVAVNGATETSLITNQTNNGGILKGETPRNGNFIRIDQGLDTEEFSATSVLDADLVETQYMIEIDNRLGQVVSVFSGNPASVSFIDDDSVASYLLSLGTDTDYVEEIGVATESEGSATSSIRGPRGTFLTFAIRSSLELRTSDFYFNELGTLGTINGVSVRIIDTNVRVTGGSTGYSLSIPVRFAKIV